MTEDTAGVGWRILKGSAWVVLARFMVRGIGLFSTIILARLLSPEDFGLVALAMIIVNGLQTMSELNFRVYLIINYDDDRRYFDTAWTLQIIRGAVIAALLIAVAPFAASFFDESRAVPIFHWLALISLIAGFENSGFVLFEKKLDFSKEFRLLLGTKLIALVVTLTCAIIWRNYWALIAGMTTAAVVRLALSFIMHPFRPRIGLHGWRKIFSFSKWLLANNWIMFLRNNGDRFVLGKLFGTTLLGLYTIAYEISNMPTTELLAPLRRALLPGYAKLAGDRAALTAAFVDGLALIVMIVAPVAAGLALVAAPAVVVFLGPKWEAAIPLVGVLAMVGFVHVWSANTSSVFLALEHPHLITKVGVLEIAILFPALILGARSYGAIGAAWAVVLVATVGSALYLVQALRFLEIPWKNAASNLWRSMVALIAMAVGVRAVEGLFPVDMLFTTNVAKLGVATAVGAAIYIAVHLALWLVGGRPAGPETHVLGMIGKLRGRLARHPAPTRVSGE